MIRIVVFGVSIGVPLFMETTKSITVQRSDSSAWRLIRWILNILHDTKYLIPGE